MNDWKSVNGRSLGQALGFLILVVWLRLTSVDGWVRFLDDANLVFHEAGHPIFGLLSQNLEVYGGTIGQLVFPAVTSFSFWQKREPVAFAMCLAWLFENFLNIGRYMADARAQILPLVGGGEHDWTDIFSRWHVLPHDIAIGHFVADMGWLGILGCGFWLIYRYILSTPSE